jgi:hypothetical protein
MSCKVYNLDFTNLFHSHRFLAVRDHCPPAALLNVCADRVFGRPVLLLTIPMSHIDVACGPVHWSVCVTQLSHFPTKY